MSTVQATLEERIRKKEQEIRQFQHQIDAAQEFVRATREALALFLKADKAHPNEGMRRGGSASKTLQYLKKEGQARHIGDIVVGIGRKNDTKNRSAVAAQLSQYVRDGKLFTRPVPNTFGLIEWGDSREDGSHGVESDQSMDAARP